MIGSTGVLRVTDAAVTGQSRPPGWALASAALAPVALVGGWLVAGAVQPPGRYDPVRQTISVLAGHAATDRWIMATGLYLIGICHLVTAAGLRGARPFARAALAGGGLAGLGIATFSQPRHGATTTHLACTVVGVVLMTAFCCLLGDPTARRFPLRPRDAALTAIVCVALLGWLWHAAHHPHVGRLGIAERVVTAQQTLWPLLAVLALRARARPWVPDTMSG